MGEASPQNRVEGERERLRKSCQIRMEGLVGIVRDYRRSDDADRIADAAFIFGAVDELSDYVKLLRDDLAAAQEENEQLEADNERLSTLYWDCAQDFARLQLFNKATEAAWETLNATRAASYEVRSPNEEKGAESG